MPRPVCEPPPSLPPQPSPSSSPPTRTPWPDTAALAPPLRPPTPPPPPATAPPRFPPIPSSLLPCIGLKAADRSSRCHFRSSSPISSHFRRRKCFRRRPPKAWRWGASPRWLSGEPSCWSSAHLLQESITRRPAAEASP